MILSENDGGNGDSGGTGWRVSGSEESVLPKMKKKKKKEKRSEGVNQQRNEKME